jgi:ATP-dependent DNA helicase Q1
MFISHCSDQIQVLLDQQERLYERQSELQALLEASKGPGLPVNGASTSAEDWSGSFEWDSQADDLRFNVFGISTYRANQREVASIVAFFFTLYIWSIFWYYI